MRSNRTKPTPIYGPSTLRSDQRRAKSLSQLNSHITASSTASSWYGGPWKPYYARLNKQGTINAWQARTNNLEQWLQVELPHTKKITGIVTQGAKSLGKEMYVISFSLQFSNDGNVWNLF
uniref:F5/8 type C domain-containing protein n=1 Tax=Periophthalmus magnuspinnatus TaxID=409849 RepID=A0A3B4AI85_9GOBI